jgi:hypothetical protein
VIDPVEELRQVDIDDEPVAFGDIGLRLCHRLMGGAPRPEAVAVLADVGSHSGCSRCSTACWITRSITVECRDCAPRRPASGFAPDAPVAADSALAAVDLRSPASALRERSGVGGSDAVHSGRPLVAHHRTQRRFYVLGITDRLHQIDRLRRAFGFAPGGLDNRRIARAAAGVIRCFQSSESRFKPVHAGGDHEALRWRRASANRVPTILKAALNHVRAERNPSARWAL